MHEEEGEGIGTMAVELKVPEVGESITEVQIGDWLKKEGEWADQDEAVVVIETDKVSVEVLAPEAGKISQVLKQTGEAATVGDVVGYLEAGEKPEKPEKPAKPDQPDEPDEPEKPDRPGKPTLPGRPAEPVVPEEPRRREQPEVPKEPPKPEVPSQPTQPDSPSNPQKPRAGGSNGSGTRVMPAAARALATHGLEASDVTPSGPGGRLLKEDVERAAREREAKPMPDGALEVSPAGREEELVPMSPLRRMVARRLVEAQQTAALLTTFNEIDMSEVMELRKRYKEAFLQRYEVKLGFMSFFVKALVDALRQQPELNAEVRGTDVAYRNYFDIGIAVGGGKGLVVPVIRNAELLSFAEVERTIGDFAQRAQSGQLKLEELQGGTFTISNGGVYGSLLSTPIVNPPQSAILGLHAIQDRPVARNGEVVVRPMMYVALTYDHRIVDGREAVTFLKRIKEALEDPARLLLEV